jgi:hypothetical protein
VKKGIGLASFRLYWEAPVWSLPHTNNGTRRQEEEQFCTHRYAKCLLKNTSNKDNKYAFNQQLEHVDDISFRELFGRIRVFFYKIRSVHSNSCWILSVNKENALTRSTIQKLEKKYVEYDQSSMQAIHFALGRTHCQGPGRIIALDLKEYVHPFNLYVLNHLRL